VHELYYWIALRLICGIGNVNYKNLLDHFGSPEKIFEAEPEELRKVAGITTKAVESILKFRSFPDIDRELDLIDSKKINIITLNSPGYPENLKNIYDPPPFLYVKGQIKKEDNNAFAVVGSRNTSEYGVIATEEISRQLALRGITIVSGMARGIDSYAHQAALACRGRTIAVLGSGVDVIYPAENRKLYHAIAEHGAVISEYPMGTAPHSYNFPARNRIISGLSTGVLVAEASLKSGSLITARLALEQGRDVFAIPGNVFSYKCKGTNKLLRSGAKLVESADDIIEELQFKVDAYAQIAKKEVGRILDLNPETQIIYELIQEEPVQINDLIIKSELSFSRLSSILLDLELSNLIKQLPGKRFIKC
jgi:DNA processing protein